MTIRTIEPSELAEARANLYQLMSMVYLKPPTSDFLKLLAGWVSSAVENEGMSRLLSEPMKYSLATLDSFFKEKWQDSQDELLKALSVEFTRLFRGVKLNYSPLPPYESVYRSEGGLVFDEVSMEVKREYRKFGLDLANELHGEPPDHLSYELEFIRLMCNREAEAWQEDNEDEALKYVQVQREFLRGHLLTWLPRFCEEIRGRDRLGLFRGLADLTESWVIFDYQQFLYTGNDQTGITNI